MALKTFNVDEEMYKKYSAHCKKQGISMSKQIEKFITQEVSRLEVSPVSHVPEPTLHDTHPMSRFC